MKAPTVSIVFGFAPAPRETISLTTPLWGELGVEGLGVRLP